MSVNNMYQPVIRPSVSRAGRARDWNQRYTPSARRWRSSRSCGCPVSTERFQRVDLARKVIRMDGVAGGPILQFLSRLAEIFQDLAVEKLDLACRTQGTHKPRNSVDDQTKAFLTLLECRLVALPVNRNCREVRNLLDQFLIAFCWAAGLAPIDREGAQYNAIRSQYRGRPARSQTVRQRGRAPSIRVPLRVRSHVQNDYLCLVARC